MCVCVCVWAREGGREGEEGVSEWAGMEERSSTCVVMYCCIVSH